ncbi:hypothetical protein JTE90_022763 [Oedothorax gibbosus]|uniref:TIL domain-containing protein n=1 Tax=Oedothorax gibbosus TaxID=931172 RepID=A0AAV6U9T5_9ARAC|nr:hypothetical protein JTE90_022763 [Oedothorax gibbosus]
MKASIIFLLVILTIIGLSDAKVPCSRDNRGTLLDKRRVEEKECGTSCPVTCSNVNSKKPISCTYQCVKGCFCKKPYIEWRGRCVLPAECPKSEEEEVHLTYLAPSALCTCSGAEGSVSTARDCQG